MIKKIVLAGVWVSMIAAPAAAQFKAEESKNGSVVASGGGNGIFMDKRDPEERDPCASGFMESGGDPKIFKDDGSASAEKGGSAEHDGDTFAESGGDPKIFKDTRSPDKRDQCVNGIEAEGGGNGI